MPGDFDCYRDEEGDCERSGIDDEIIDDSQDSDVLELNRVVDFFKKPHRTSGRSAVAAAVSGNRTSKENCRGETFARLFGVIMPKTVAQAGETKAPMKKRKAAEESFEEQSSRKASHTYRDVPNVIKKRIGKKAVEGAKPILEKGLQNDRIDLRQSLSDPSMDSGSSLRHSEEPGERQIVNQKQSKTMTGEDLDGNVTWTDESVKFLLDTYAAVHQRLGEQSNGQVKYQKKWMSILWAMQQRFGKHFTKKQCQSKYWCVRRECTDYWHMSSKISQSDPSWNPNVAGRELLKPKFYDVWYEVSEKAQVHKPSCGTGGDSMGGEEGLTADSGQNPLKSQLARCLRKEEKSSIHEVQDCDSTIREMQRLMQIQLQASEKREEAMKYRTELMMELLTQHMEHVEKRVSNSEENQQPHHYLLERINDKLEKVIDGFTTLNENLSIVTYQISKTLETC